MATSTKKKSSSTETKEKKTEKQEAPVKARKLPGFFSFNNKKFVVLAAFIFAFAAFGSYRLYTTRAASGKKIGRPFMKVCHDRYLNNRGYTLGQNHISQGDCVVTLQDFLNYSRQVKDSQWPVLNADGQFGPQTQRAVERFQSHNVGTKPAIAADGVVGPQTWGHIYAKCTQNNDNKFYCGYPVNW